MIHAIATIELNPGTREAWLAEFKKIQPYVRAEKGCIEYGAMVDPETTIPVQVPHRPDALTLVEKWESMEHLTAHMTASHMTTYRQQVKPFVIRLSLQVLEPVS